MFTVDKFWKLFCLGCWGTNDSPGGRVFQGRAKVRRKLCKLTIKQTSSKDNFQRFHQHFECTSLLTVSQSLYIVSHCKTCIFLNKHILQKNYHWNYHMTFKINKLYKISSIYRIKCWWGPTICYSCIFIPLDYKVSLYHLNSSVLLIDKQNERYKFLTKWLMVTVADTASGCQLMRHSHAEKDVKKNENFE